MINRNDLNSIGISKNNNHNDNKPDGINTVAYIVKKIAIIIGIVGVFFAIVVINNQTYSIPVLIASITSAIFVYALGEIIQLLEDIKNK
ncbi:MAG: hypothetical protein J6A89_04420 [Clostridia bacterium]|nr:hypothetical protein [Clostridia bacterium]